jgi:A118 family predicted phage portal protein
MSLSKNKRQDIISAITKRGQNPTQGTIHTIMPVWKSWWRGNVNDFHRYQVTTVDGVQRDCELLTMNMAKKGCEDWTTLIWNEAVLKNITVDNKGINDKVHNVLEDNNFLVEYANILEKTWALGTGAMVEFVANNKIMIDYIIGDMIVVSSYRNQKINGICTVNVIQKEKEVLTHLTYHDLKDITTTTNGVSETKTVYTIEHEVFVNKNTNRLGKSAPLIGVFSQQDLEAMAAIDGVELVVDSNNNIFKVIITFETDTAHFQVLKPNIVNNFDADNPMGIAIFANSIDNLKSMDLKFDSFSNEFELAKHRIMVDATQVTKEVTKATPTGMQITRPFDTRDKVFLGMNLSNSNKAIEFYNAEIRAEEHKTGINFDVQTYGFKIGLGTDYYAFDARGVYQNEKAVVSENSDLWASKKKHEQTMLIAPITNLVKAILFLLRETGEIEGDIDKLKITVKPDDSIIIDDEAQYQKDLDLVDRNMMSSWQVLVKWFGLTEEEARKQVLEAEGVSEELDNPMLTPNEGEDEETFIARFMSNEDMMLEFPDETQRRAVAQEQFDKSGS